MKILKWYTKYMLELDRCGCGIQTFISSQASLEIY